MRTTLKRGMGRAATLNGNGARSCRPAVLEPMRRYRQPRAAARGRRAASLAQGLRLDRARAARGRLGLAGGALSLRSRDAERDRAAHRGGQAVHEAPASVADGVRARNGARSSATTSAPAREAFGRGLALGHDDARPRRSDEEHDVAALVPARPDRRRSTARRRTSRSHRPDQLRVVELRRAGNARHGREAHGRADQLPDHLDFHGFKLLVNKLHGVYVDVDHRYINTVGGPGGYAKIDLEPGYQKLDGQQALDFVRFRHTDSDLYRLARQQLFLEALKDRVALELLDSRDPAARRRAEEQRRDRRGGRRRAERSRDPVVRGPRLPPAGRAPLPPQHRKPPGLRLPQRAGVRAAAATSRPPSTTFMHPDVTLPDRANSGRARAQAEAAKAAGAEASADHDARPQRDDDRRPRARHLVQARGRRLPHRAAAGVDAGRRADAELRRHDRLLRLGRSRTRSRRPQQLQRRCSARTRASRRCRPRSRRTRSRRAIR